MNPIRSNKPNNRRKRGWIRILIQKQGLKCCYCGVEMHNSNDGPPERRVTLEHLHRLAEGGKNTIGNVALACYACNVGRGSVDWFTYKTYKMGELFCE